MAVNGREIARVRCSTGSRWAGLGFLAGSAPVSSDPDAPDGRLRILNQPAIGRIMVLDRRTFEVIATTRSRPDGTWRVDRIMLGMQLLVVGLDDRGNVNAAVQDWVVPAPME